MDYKVTQEIQQKIELLLNAGGKTQNHEIKFLAEILQMQESGKLEESIIHFEQQRLHGELDTRAIALNTLRVYRAAQSLIETAQRYVGKVPESPAELDRAYQEELLFFESALSVASRNEEGRGYRAKLRDVGQCAFEYFCVLVALRQESLQRQFALKNRILPDDPLAPEKNFILGQLTREQEGMTTIQRAMWAYEHAQDVDPEWKEKVRDLEDELHKGIDRQEQLRVQYLALISLEQRAFADDMTRGFYSLN